MKTKNDQIVEKIKKARVEKGFTQKDLADHLGRTAASISDLERGKVQVTASDLYKISQYLKKPIEYFFGEDFGGKEIQDLVSLLRIQSPDNRKANIEYIQKTIKLQELGKVIASQPEDEISPEQMKEFMEVLIDLTNMNKSSANQVENATKRLLTEIDFKGIDFGEYLSKLKTD
ncbi:MAG: helix-turn-helix domain-containing protein [Anaerolineaceae bacterium]|nr:helix-turn-helix domain-containing protein [Anaerolineaceae bacterium]